MDPEHLGAGAVIAVVSAELLQMVKSSKWVPWITHDSESLNRFVSGVIAFLAGLGISFQFDPATGTLVVTGLLTSSIAHGVAQWVQQQVYYRLVIAKKEKAS